MRLHACGDQHLYLPFCFIELLVEIYTLFHMHFRLQAAIFDFSLTPTHGSVLISPVVLPDLENIGIYRWNVVAIMCAS